MDQGQNNQHTQNLPSGRSGEYLPESNISSDRPNTTNEIGKAALFNPQENPNNNTQEVTDLGSEFNFPPNNNEELTQSLPRDDVPRNDGLTSSHTEKPYETVKDVEESINKINVTLNGEDLANIYDEIRSTSSTGEGGRAAWLTRPVLVFFTTII